MGVWTGGHQRQAMPLQALGEQMGGGWRGHTRRAHNSEEEEDTECLVKDNTHGAWRALQT